VGGDTKKFKSPKLEMKVGMPCDSCNHGWMSGLESQVKTFMTQMMYRGEKTLLDPERQAHLTRWIINTAMVYEFTSTAAERKYFSDAERLAFKERFEIPQNVWICIARYDGVRPMHSLQHRAPKSPDLPPRIYLLTLSANFLVVQVFAFRESEGNLGEVARATKPERLLHLFPASPAWMSWPPPTTIDDEALDVLDTRFVKVLGASNPAQGGG
jgi:hypothetical protein